MSEKIKMPQTEILPKKVKIPLHEFEIATARSGGPGGQHVNKTESKVIVRLPLGATKTLSEEQKEILRDVLKNQINKADELVVSTQSNRSQHLNYIDAMQKIHHLINEALTPEKERVKTRVPEREKDLRVASKKSRGTVKKTRGKVSFED